MPRHLLWAPVLVAVGILSAAASLQEAQEQLKTYQQNIRQEKKDLENVRERLRREKQAVRRQKQKERSVLFEIQRLGKKLEEADERYQDDQENLRLVRNRIAHLRYEVQGTETELARLREFLAARLRMIYRERQIGFWKMLVTSQSLSQALSRLKFFHVLAEQNAYLIKTVAHKRRQLLVSTQKLMIQEQKAEELEQASKHSLEKLQATQQERESYLHRVRVMRTEHEQALKELDQASRRLSALINKLEQRRRTLQRKLTQYGQGFARRRGTLPWPTRGRVVSSFGKKRHPRFNTYIYNKGIDIKGAIGQNVISVCQGQVLFAEWFEGFGRMVILDHGGGYSSVYAHLQKILVSEGDAVSEGKTVGTLGDSGTWKGPCLYFEIRKRAEALDPVRWLER